MRTKALFIMVAIFIASVCLSEGMDNKNPKSMETKANGQIKLPKYFYKVFEGTIGTKKVRVILTRNNSSITGYYFDYSDGTPISFADNGKFGKDNSISLKELGEENKDGTDNVTGLIDAKFISNNTLEGVLKKSKNDKGMQLRLKESYGKNLCRAEMHNYEKSVNGPKKNGSKIKINLSCPTIEYSEDKAFEKAINDSIMKMLQRIDIFESDSKHCTNVDNIIDKYIKTGKNLLKEMGGSIQIEHEGNIEICGNDNGILCLSLYNYDESGGAHGYSSKYYSNYIMGNPAKIQEEDLFKSGYKPFLNNLALKEILNQYDKDTYDEETIETIKSTFENDRAFLNNHLSIWYNGLEYDFSFAELAPMLPETTIFIPYSSIESIIKPGGPLAAFVK